MNRHPKRRVYPPPSERLAAGSIPEPNTGCILWLGATRDGYGLIRVQVDGKSRSRNAHRVAYEIANGAIPESLVVDHKCRVRCCINPYHLEPVTQGVNVARGIEAGVGAGVAQRTASSCLRGHPLEGDNLYLYGGKRGCRECRRNASRTSGERDH